ncbi:hypothetical protein ACQ4M3_37270 [Leptolyngbya sp. AN03gr2]|uniref:hypothetical protein n=1 Tax=unclassified Leptolyngbya TaxID=2650499 RepID=UPI003D3149F1
MAVRLSLLDTPVKSPFLHAPYIAKLGFDARSEILCWSEVATLHETARSLCPQRFAWWQSLPPEVWISSLIYPLGVPELPGLPMIPAMRIDLLPAKQFSSNLEVYLSCGQLITLRKIAYRVRSDFEQYAFTGIAYRG